MAGFATAFREHTAPRLRALCVAHGSSIAHGLESFTEAAAKVTGAAIALGASHLPGTLFDELEDHLLTMLANAAHETEVKLKSLGA
jgi:hypothetical protein